MTAPLLWVCLCMKGLYTERRPPFPLTVGVRSTLAISQEEVNESESSPDGQKLANYELWLLKIEERLRAGASASAPHYV